MEAVDTIEKHAASHLELSAQLSALTALVGALATTEGINFTRLEECVSWAANRLRPGRRPAVLRNAATLLQELEVMRMLLEDKSRKSRERERRARTTPLTTARASSTPMNGAVKVPKPPKAATRPAGRRPKLGLPSKA
ncbi:MAG: hypothetical protein ACHQF3_11515 [Alphaproteobacteria bacterium]